MPVNPQIHATGLPDCNMRTVDFLESSFFKDNDPGRCLPTPAEVRALSTDPNSPQPPPVRFENLNLIVKFGPHVTTAEAQCLWAIKNTLGDKVPVPEVYGWRISGRDVFIYMELIRGNTLQDEWNALSIADKIAVCDQLHTMMASLREVEQDPNDIFIGSLDRHNLLDYVLEDQPSKAPFASVKDFNDWFSGLCYLQFPVEEDFEDPWREGLPDGGTIKLTHGDLHRGNVIISSSKPPHVLAIVDWAHAGWYPDYWEYCKAAYTSAYDGDWRLKWIPMFLTPRTEVHEVFADYIHAMGAV